MLRCVSPTHPLDFDNTRYTRYITFPDLRNVLETNNLHLLYYYICISGFKVLCLGCNRRVSFGCSTTNHHKVILPTSHHNGITTKLRREMRGRMSFCWFNAMYIHSNLFYTLLD